MAYDNVISRSDTEALVPEQVADLITHVVEQSAAATLFRRIPVSSKQTRIPIISALPTAYWVNGDTGLKQTTEVAWANKYLNIEEVAAIIPIPEAVLDDTDYDVWGSIKPLLEEAAGRVVDAAIFFGSNAPAIFPSNISTAAAAAGNTVTEGALAAAGGFADDVDEVYEKVEEDGYDVMGVVAARSAKSKFRRARNAEGERLSDVAPDLSSVNGDSITYTMKGLFPSGLGAGSNVRLFAGDWSQFMFGMRQDVTYKVLDQAVIQGPDGTIMFNLAQQDMVALRMTMRCGWQIANIINFEQPVEANRYPAARLVY